MAITLPSYSANTAVAPMNPILDSARRAALGTATSSTPPSVPAEEELVTTQVTMPSATLNKVKAGIEQNQIQVAANKKYAESSMKQSQLITDVLTSAVSEAANADATIALVKDTAAMQAQNATREAYSAAATSPEYQKLVMGRLAEDNKRIEELLNQNMELGAREHTGIKLIDNVINQFSINLNRQELLNAQNQQTQTVQEIASVTGATDSFAKTNANLAESITTASIAANQRKIGANARVATAEAELRGLNFNADQMAKVMAADQAQTAQLMSMYRIEEEELNRQDRAESRQLQRENAAQSREQWAASAEARKIDLEVAKIGLAFTQDIAPYKRDAYITQIKHAELNYLSDKERTPIQIAEAKLRYKNLVETAPTSRALLERQLELSKKQEADNQQLEDSLVNAVTQSQALLGLPVDNAKQITWGLQQTGAIGAKYDNLYLMASSPNKEIASNPFDAVSVLSIVDPNGTMPETKASRLLDDIQQIQDAKYLNSKQPVPRDDETRKVNFNETAKEHMKAKAANIVTGDTSNPYHAPPMSVIEKSSAVVNSVFYNKVVKGTGKTEFDPQWLTDQAVMGVQNKLISVEEAASGIQAMANAAVVYNNTESGGFARVGLPSQNSYVTTVNRPKTFVETAVQYGFEAVITSTGPLAKAVPDSYTDANRKGKKLAVDLTDMAQVKKTLVLNLSSTPKPKEGTN